MTVSGTTGDVSSRLAELRERFVIRAADDLAVLEQLAAHFRDGRVTVDTLADVGQRLHRLAGSAGTFGLAELGAAARNLEKLLRTEASAGKKVSTAPLTVSAEAIDQLLALRSMLAVVPDTQTGADQVQAIETPEGSHGGQVRVLVIPGRGKNFDSLVAALAGYGFDCQVMTGPDSEIFSALSQQALNAMVILCSASRVAGVTSARDASASDPVRRLPVVCLSDEDSFERRYQVANQGADAFFCEPLDLPELTERIEYLAIERSTRAQGRVVMVEDDPELAQHYSLVLESAGVKVRWVKNPVDLMAELSAFQPDILLMDVQLGGYSGVTLARLVRFDSQWLSLPIIYLSSEDDPDSQLEALSRGADEFLLKPVSDGYLTRSVLIRCFRARQLSRLMNLDSLTGLLKHSLIKQEVDHELARCRRDGHHSSVVMVDLDHFKNVNDTYGHRCGDMVIKTLANLLRNRLRETDRIGRYGGEEFLVVLPGSDSAAAAGLFTEIAENFARLSFSCGAEAFQVTLSAGIADIDQFGSGGEATGAADQALYARKRAGRNGVTVYSDNG